MNKWWWAFGGVVVGYLVAPKIAALLGGRVPQLGK